MSARSSGLRRASSAMISALLMNVKTTLPLKTIPESTEQPSVKNVVALGTETSKGGRHVTALHAASTPPCAHSARRLLHPHSSSPPSPHLCDVTNVTGCYTLSFV